MKRLLLLLLFCISLAPANSYQEAIAPNSESAKFIIALAQSDKNPDDILQEMVLHIDAWLAINPTCRDRVEMIQALKTGSHYLQTQESEDHQAVAALFDNAALYIMERAFREDYYNNSNQ